MVCEQFADSSSMKCGTCWKFESSAIPEVVQALGSSRKPPIEVKKVFLSISHIYIFSRLRQDILTNIWIFQTGLTII